MILLKLTGILKDEYFLLSRDIKHLSGLETVFNCATFKHLLGVTTANKMSESSFHVLVIKPCLKL